MNIICGSLEPQSKSIRFDNKTIDIPFKKPDLLLYLPQFNFIPEHLTLKRIFNDFEIEFTSFEKLFPDISVNYKSPIKHLSGGHRRIVEVFVIAKMNTICAIR